jgi:DNA repair protein RadC
MDYRIKDLPESERPREKLAENGLSSLTKTELVSLIIRFGISGKNVKELSSEILKSYSLAELADVPADELEQIQGVSRVKSGQLKAASELAKRLQREEKEKIESFSDLRSVVADMKYESREKLRLILLKSSNEVIDIYEQEGQVDSVDFRTRDLLNQVISRDAAGFILCHNHPSGDAEPTQADIRTTEELIEASETVGVELLDHVIVGEDVLSMKQSTDLEF